LPDHAKVTQNDKMAFLGFLTEMFIFNQHFDFCQTYRVLNQTFDPKFILNILAKFRKTKFYFLSQVFFLGRIFFWKFNVGPKNPNSQLFLFRELF